MAIYLDKPPNYTLEKNGVKEALWNTTGCKKVCVTVVLTATANGRKLPPLLILIMKTTQIRGVSELCYSQGPGNRMNDRGAVDGVAENSMES
jgi:hypothetical protein